MMRLNSDEKSLAKNIDTLIVSLRQESSEKITQNTFKEKIKQLIQIYPSAFTNYDLRCTDDNANFICNFVLHKLSRGRLQIAFLLKANPYTTEILQGIFNAFRILSSDDQDWLIDCSNMDIEVKDILRQEQSLENITKQFNNSSIKSQKFFLKTYKGTPGFKNLILLNYIKDTINPFLHTITSPQEFLDRISILPENIFNHNLKVYLHSVSRTSFINQHFFERLTDLQLKLGLLCHFYKDLPYALGTITNILLSPIGLIEIKKALIQKLEMDPELKTHLIILITPLLILDPIVAQLYVFHLISPRSEKSKKPIDSPRIPTEAPTRLSKLKPLKVSPNSAFHSTKPQADSDTATTETVVTILASEATDSSGTGASNEEEINTDSSDDKYDRPDGGSEISANPFAPEKLEEILLLTPQNETDIEIQMITHNKEYREDQKSRQAVIRLIEHGLEDASVEVISTQAPDTEYVYRDYTMDGLLMDPKEQDLIGSSLLCTSNAIIQFSAF